VDADASTDGGRDGTFDGPDATDGAISDIGPDADGISDSPPLPSDHAAIDAPPDSAGDVRVGTDSEAAAPDGGSLDTGIATDGGADATYTDAVETSVPEAEAGSWTPAQLPNLALWLDADTGVAVTNGVLAWADHSGHGHVASQALADFRPSLVPAALHGHSVIRFDGQNDTLTVADANDLRWGTGEFVVEIVASFSNPTNAGDGYGLLFSKQAANYPFSGPSLWANYPFPSLSTVFVAQLQLGATAATPATGLNDGVARLYGARRMTTVLEARVNGSSARMSSVPSVDVSAPGQFAFIGGQQTGSGVIQALKGDIAEIVAVAGNLDGSDLARLETFLITKYGL
jgi:hypothetical protein